MLNWWKKRKLRKLETEGKQLVDKLFAFHLTHEAGIADWGWAIEVTRERLIRLDEEMYKLNKQLNQ